MSGFGLIPTTLIDYPGEVAATLFVPGCNLRCPYCHNPELVSPPYPSDLPAFEEILSVLRKRSSVLSGVCVTGGEPLLHPDIEFIIEEIGKLGLLIKIDTNGTLPERLRKVKPDFIAMDIKTAPEKYARVGFTGEGGTIHETARWIKHSGIAHEFRTTVAPNIVTEEDFPGILSLVKGAKRYTLTPFRPGTVLDSEYGKTVPYKPDFITKMRQFMRDNSIPCTIRGMKEETHDFISG